MRSHDLTEIGPTREAQDRWVDAHDKIANATLNLQHLHALDTHEPGTMFEFGSGNIEADPDGQGILCIALREFGAHVHHERNHQGLGNALILRRACIARRDGPIDRRSRLGGLLNYYECAPA
jgi:hypothetical protein